jgi:DMSO/TMAO reductase YedYZ molybdopterin-dependent catalytic subunit
MSNDEDKENVMLGMTEDMSTFDRGEMMQAMTNCSAMPLELFAMPVTPTDSHYVLSHFGVPQCVIDAYSERQEDAWQLSIKVGNNDNEEVVVSVGQLKSDERLQRVRCAVTLECAGNSRATMSPRKKSISWLGGGGVSTARWSGVRLTSVLEHFCGVRSAGDDAFGDVVFTGADGGIEFGALVRGEFESTPYQFSLRLDECCRHEVMLAFAMNDDDHIAVRHGFPLRLIVPGVYGMASVKYLRRIEVRAAGAPRFRGWQKQVYRLFREVPVGVRDPEKLARIVAESSEVLDIQVKSALAPPGVAVDLHAVKRHVVFGGGDSASSSSSLRDIELRGQAWAGRRDIASVHVAIASVNNNDDNVDNDDNDDEWHEATLCRSNDAPFAWSSFTFTWRNVAAGAYRVRVRAIDCDGNVQPQRAAWNYGGYQNNSIQQTTVTIH